MSWICCKCCVAVEESDEIAINYGDMDLPEAEGLVCPSCHASYLLKDFVVDQLKPAEEMLQGK